MSKTIRKKNKGLLEGLEIRLFEGIPDRLYRQNKISDLPIYGLTGLFVNPLYPTIRIPFKWTMFLPFTLSFSDARKKKKTETPLTSTRHVKTFLMRLIL